MIVVGARDRVERDQDRISGADRDRDLRGVSVRV